MRRACLPDTGWGERLGGSCDVRCARGSRCAGTAGASEGGRRADGRGVLVAGRVTAGAAAAASRHCTMSGQLERCEREWHELEGQFQELQVGPGHLVSQLCHPRCSAFPFLLPQPGRLAPSGPRGCSWPSPGGWWSSWAGPVPSHSTSVLHPLGAPRRSRYSPALAPALCSAHLLSCRKLVSRLRGSEVLAMSMWGRPEGTGICRDSEQPSPHLRRGRLSPHPRPSAFGSSTPTQLSWGSLPTAAPFWKMCLGDVHLEPLGLA